MRCASNCRFGVRPSDLFNCAWCGQRAAAREAEEMECIECGSAAIFQRERAHCLGLRRFRCRACGKQLDERECLRWCQERMRTTSPDKKKRRDDTYDNP